MGLCIGAVCMYTRCNGIFLQWDGDDIDIIPLTPVLFLLGCSV